MKDLPISEYVKEYYKTHGIVLSDFEKASVYYHSDLLDEEITEALREIAETTEDTALKAQIEDRIRYDREAYELFSDNSKGEFIYKITQYDDGSGMYCFTLAKKALDFALKYSEAELIIYKIKLDPQDDCDWETIGECQYDRSGRLIYVSSHEHGWLEDTHGRFQRFEDAFLSVEYPFERGDIVRIEGDSELGVVETSKKDWEKVCKDAENRKEVTYFDSEAFVTVDRIGDDGNIKYEHCNMLKLEKAEEADTVEWNMMNELSKLILGKNKMANFAYYYDLYRNSY